MSVPLGLPLCAIVTRARLWAVLRFVNDALGWTYVENGVFGDFGGCGLDGFAGLWPGSEFGP